MLFNLQILIIKFVICAILEIYTEHKGAHKYLTATRHCENFATMRHSVNLPSTPNAEVKIVQYIYPRDYSGSLSMVASCDYGISLLLSSSCWRSVLIAHRTLISEKRDSLLIAIAIKSIQHATNEVRHHHQHSH